VQKSFCLGLQLAVTAFASYFNKRNKELQWSVIVRKIQALTHLFVKVHTYLDQETAKEPFWSETTSELVCLFVSTLFY